MADRQKKSGGARKIGRCLRKNSKQNYKAHGRRTKNKLRRIARSNGDAAVKSYRKDPRANFPTSRKGRGRVNAQGMRHVRVPITDENGVVVGSEYRFVKAA